MGTNHVDQLRAFLKPRGETDPKQAAALIEAFQSFGVRETSPSLLLYRPVNRRFHARVVKQLNSKGGR